jgi:hypothetical protein
MASLHDFLALCWNRLGSSFDGLFVSYTLDMQAHLELLPLGAPELMWLVR